MSDRELQELFRLLDEIYIMHPKVAQELLRRILEILQSAGDEE